MNELLVGGYVAGVLLASVFNGYMISETNREMTPRMLGVVILWPIAVATAIGIIVETVGDAL